MSSVALKAAFGRLGDSFGGLWKRALEASDSILLMGIGKETRTLRLNDLHTYRMHSVVCHGGPSGRHTGDRIRRTGCQFPARYKTGGGRLFGTAPRETPHLRRTLWKDYKQLSKLRLSGLVTATAAAGFVAASTESIDWKTFGWTSLGTMLCSSSANALNQLYEIANDARMTRTCIRPLPQKRMSRGHAAVFAMITGLSGVYILADKVNATTAWLGGGNIALYAMVYTPLKQISIINTWVGAVVGAIPPLMGWAGAIGTLDAGAFLLSAGLYFWQMPHFMALAWLCRKDYAAGGYKMLSLVDPTGKRTAACALRNCMYLLPLGPLSTWLGITSPYFAYESAFISAGMLLTAATFYAKPSNMNARILFRASLVHLPVFMAAFLLHRIPNTGDDRMTLLLEHARLLGFVRHGDGGSYSKRQQETLHNHPSIFVEGRRQHGDHSLSEESSAALVPGSPPLPFLPIPRRPPQHSKYDNHDKSM